MVVGKIVPLWHTLYQVHVKFQCAHLQMQLGLAPGSFGLFSPILKLLQLTTKV